MSDAQDADPKSRAFDALEAFTEAVEAAEDKPPGARLIAQERAFNELTDTLAECYIAGMNVPAGMFADTVAEVSKLNKTEAKEDITRKIRELKDKNQNRPFLHNWIEDELEEVRIRRTTDHKQDTVYVWDFGTVTVETQSGADAREHYGWSLFRDAIKDAGGPYLADPPEALQDGSDWREWIVGIEEQRSTTMVYTGPRTHAVDHLKDRVRASDGYGEVADAADMNGCYVEVNNDPPEGTEPVDDTAPEQECPLWRVELLMVPNGWVTDAVEEYGISHRALQNELEARGYTIDGRSKISTQEYVGGRFMTFWVLNGDFAAPAAYQPEAVEPADGLAADAPGPGTVAADGGDDPDRDTGSVGGEADE